jgi:hypothetical protein
MLDTGSVRYTDLSPDRFKKLLAWLKKHLNPAIPLGKPAGN